MSKLDRYGAYITGKIGTMWCAIIFLLISMISLPAAIQANDAFVFISWLSQSFLQLVLLPIIMVGQRVLTDSTDALHDHHERHHAKLDQIIATLSEIRDEEDD